MITFPGCKINLGLYIERKRPDGYHDISTVMYPVPWSDVLEAVPARDGCLSLTVTGRAVDCPMEKNLVVKAYRAIERHVRETDPVRAARLAAPEFHLRKIVPDGAGLGGGSADAAAAIRLTDEVLKLGLSEEEMEAVAATVGADCPFFIRSKPALATGTGTTLRPVDVSLGGYTLLIAKPAGCSVSTAQAYAGVVPTGDAPDLGAILSLPPEQWEAAGLRNDFEASVFAVAPGIGVVKATMLDAGAAYAAMSGSGASVFGLFARAEDAARAERLLSDCDLYRCTL